MSMMTRSAEVTLFGHTCISPAHQTGQMSGGTLLTPFLPHLGVKYSDVHYIVTFDPSAYLPHP